MTFIIRSILALACIAVFQSSAIAFDASKAYNISSQDEYLDVDTQTLNKIESWSFQCWFYADGDGKRTIYSEGNPQVTLYIRVNDNNSLQASVYNNRKWANISTSSNAVVNGRWNNIAVTLSGATDDISSGELNIYLNGSLIKSGKSFRQNHNDTKYTAIGRNVGWTRSGGQSADAFSGVIDEMSVWTKVLTESEIRRNMFVQPVVSAAGLAAYWRFDEESDSVIDDLAGDADATMQNPTALSLIESTIPVANPPSGFEAPEVAWSARTSASSGGASVELEGNIGEAYVELSSSVGGGFEESSLSGVDSLLGSKWSITRSGLQYFALEWLNPQELNASGAALILSSAADFSENVRVIAFDSDVNGLKTYVDLSESNERLYASVCKPAVYSDDGKLRSSAGWGPFSQGYDNDNLFKLFYIPDEAENAMYKISANRQTIDSTYTENLSSYAYEFNIGELRATSFIEANYGCASCPDNGVSFFKKITITPIAPKITVTTSDSSGFFYQIGKNGEKKFNASSLPDGTYEVSFRIYDAYDKLVPNAEYTDNGADISESSWDADLRDYDLTLSSVLGVTVKHSGGVSDGTEYRVPLNVVAAPETLDAKSKERAIKFEGGDDYVSIENASIINRGEWTFEAWIKPSGSGKRSVYTEGDPKILFDISVTSSNQLEIGVFNIDKEGGPWLHFTGEESSVPNDKWTHIAATLEKTDDGAGLGVLKLFLNGEKVLEAPCHRGKQSKTVHAALGRNVGSTLGGNQSANPFVGEMDEIRIWNRALDDFNINKNLRRQFSSTPLGLLNYWKANETSGSTLGNSADDSNDGSLHNMSDAWIETARKAGDEPFYTNNYDKFAGARTAPSKPLVFTLSSLPPRTTKVKFLIKDVDDNTIDSSFVERSGDEFLDQAAWQYDVATLPLDVRRIECRSFCAGGPSEGITFSGDLLVEPCAVEADFDSGKRTFQEYQATRSGLKMLGSSGVDIGENYFEFPNGITVEAWIKPENLAKSDKVYRILGPDLKLGVIRKTDSDKLTLHYHHANTYEMDFDYSEGYVRVAVSQAYKKSTLYAFDVDGNLIASKEFDHYDYLSGNINTIGYDPSDDGSLPFKGVIDNLRIWSDALTLDKLRQVAFVSNVEDKDLLLNWTFDDARNVKNYVYESSSGRIRGKIGSSAIYASNAPPANPDSIDSANFFPVDRDVQTLRILRPNRESADNDTSFVIIDWLGADDKVYLSERKTFDKNDNAITHTYDYGLIPFSVDKIAIKYNYAEKASTDDYDIILPIRITPPAPASNASFGWKDLRLGMGLYNQIHVFNIQSGTDSVKIEIDDSDGARVAAKSFAKASPPYSHSLKLDGSTAIVKSKDKTQDEVIKDMSVYKKTIWFWFKTSSNKGGSIVKLAGNSDGGGKQQLNCYLDEDGKLHFGCDMGGVVAQTESQAKFNDGKWHNILLTIDAKIKSGSPHKKVALDLSMIADGAKIDEHSVEEHCSGDGDRAIDGYWIFGGGSVDDKWYENPSAQHLNMDICEFSVWNDALFYDTFGPGMHSEIDAASQNKLQLYYKFDEGDGDSASDSKGSNDADVDGKKNWKRDDSPTNVVYSFNTGNLEIGAYDVWATVYSKASGAAGFKYKLNVIDIVRPWWRIGNTHDMTLKSNYGLGYFQEGSKSNVKFTFDTDAPFNDKNVLLQVGTSRNPNARVVYSKTIDRNSWPIEFELDMGSFGPQFFMVLSWLNGQTDYEAWIPLYINSMAEPHITGDFGPFTQSIAPGSMQAMNSFTLKTSADDVSKVRAVFEDVYGNRVGNHVTTLTEKDGEFYGDIEYDMATLFPPYTNMFIEYYLGEDDNPAFISGPYRIEIEGTRPAFFDDRAEFSDVETVEDTVFFTIDTPFDVAPTAKNVKDFELPDYVPLFGDNEVLMDIPKLKADMRYTISKDKLEFEQNPTLSYKLKIFTNKTTTREFDFEENSTNECEYCGYHLNDDNELIAIQRDLHDRDIYLPLLEWYETVKEFKEIMDEGVDANPYSVVIKGYWSFDIGFGVSQEYQTNVGVDDDGVWGSLGPLEPPEKGDDKSSHQYAAIGADLTVSVGAKILEGLASVEVNLTGGLRVGAGEIHHVASKREAKYLKSMEVDIEFSITAHELFGLFKEYIWRPHPIHKWTIGDELPENFPKVVVHWVGGGLEAGDRKTGDKPFDVKTENPTFRLNAATNPQPRFGSNGENFAAAWLEQEFHSGYGSLKIAPFNREKSAFERPVEISASTSAIAAPDLDLWDNGNLVVAWSQCRYNKSTLPKGLSIIDIYKARDVWFAVYDAEAETVATVGVVPDDFSDERAGRTEGSPEVAALDDGKALLVWKEADLTNGGTKALFSIIEKDSEGKWICGEAQYIDVPAGIILEMKLVDYGDAASLICLRMDERDSEKSELISIKFDGNSWTTPQTIAKSGEGEFINDFDASACGEYSALAFIVNLEYVEAESQSVKFVSGDGDGNWNSQIETLFESDEFHISDVEAAINCQGLVSILIEKNEYKQFGAKRESLLDVFYANMSQGSPQWTSENSNPFVGDSSKAASSLDLVFGENNTLFIIGKENAPAYREIIDPAFGALFGKQDMNCVLRAVKISTALGVEDVDEQDILSSVRSEIQAPSRFDLRISPNPAQSFAQAEFFAPVAGNYAVELRDLYGKRIETIANRRFESGMQKIAFDVSNLASGAYAIVIDNGQISTARTFIVVR